MISPAMFLSTDPEFVKVNAKPHLALRIFAWMLRHWKALTFITLAVWGLFLTMNQTAGFASFMLEEGSQQLGFGTFMYQASKQWPEMREAILHCIVVGKRHLRWTKTLSRFNWFTGWAFIDYQECNLKKLEWQLKSVNKRLGKIESQVAVIEKKIDKPDSKLLSALPHLAVQAMPAPALSSLHRVSLRPSVNLRPTREEPKTVSGSVVATQYGAKYHTRTCGSVRGKNVRAMSVREAVSEGLDACKRCKP